jgi:hypothetical protein
MRLTFLLGIVYLAILKVTNPGLRRPEVQMERASIVWGSVAPHNGESA